MKIPFHKLGRKLETTFPRWSAALLLLGFLFSSVALPAARGEVRAAAHQAPPTLDVIINEIAWMGTAASSYDEWIELYNPGSVDIDLTDWLLTDNGDINKTLSGTIFAGEYYLLERTNDDTISNITADDTYSGNLGNTVEVLELWDNGTAPKLIDTANKDGTAWYAGDNDTKASMERIAVIADSPSAWVTNNGITINGLDGDDPPNPILGTPKQPNSFSYPPRSIIINEVAWAGTEAYFGDEWIELYNPNTYDIDLVGWRLVSDSGEVDIFLNGTVFANSYFLLERNDESITSLSEDMVYNSGLLADTGEVLRLLAPDRSEIDTANSDGGVWPAGTTSPPSSMERMSADKDTDDNWVTNVNVSATANDAAGNSIYGTPGYANWGYSVVYTPVPPATITPTPTTSMTLLINEVAWAGTAASSADEWIELYNPNSYNINLDGWRLVAADGEPDISLSGTIPKDGYFLLERSNDDTVSDIEADQIYPYTDNTLSNDGEKLMLIDPGNNVVDYANRNYGNWPAGTSSPSYGSMERRAVVEDSDSAWITNTGIVKNGKDAEGNPINGTPKEANWAFSVTATPSPIPSRTPIPSPTPSRTPTPYPFQSVVLNEVLPRAAHDWNEDGTVDVYDEFIEIINRGTRSINLQGWKIDDERNSGSQPYTLPNISLAAGERIAIFSSVSHISLSDGGDTVRLIKSNGQISDVVTYTVVKKSDQSWCRFPEHGFWRTDCFPTPHEENVLSGKAFVRSAQEVSHACLVPDTVPDAILRVECGGLGINVINSAFWDELTGDAPVVAITGRAKWSTWFR